MKWIGSVTRDVLNDIENQLIALHTVAMNNKIKLLHDAYGNVPGLREMALREVDEEYFKELEEIRNFKGGRILEK